MDKGEGVDLRRRVLYRELRKRRFEMANGGNGKKSEKRIIELSNRESEG